MTGHVLSLLNQPEDDDPRARGELTLPVPEGWPAPPQATVYHGLVGEIVQTIAPQTEADRATRGRTLRVNTQDRRVD